MGRYEDDSCVTSTTRVWDGKSLAEMKQAFETLYCMESIHTTLTMRKKHHQELAQQWNANLAIFVDLNIVMIDQILENLSKLTSNRFAYFYFDYFHQVVQQRHSDLFDPEREKEKRREVEKKDQQVGDIFMQDLEELQEAHKQGRVSAKIQASA